jgi:hypothetical protein
VGARAPGRAASFLERVEGEPGSHFEVALRLEGDGGEVEGIVLDAEGKPIAAAIVCVGEELSWQNGGSKQYASGTRARTQDDGRFRVEGISTETMRDRPAGMIPVFARAYGFAPATQSVTIRPGTPTHVEFRLGRGAILEGLVLSEDGKPVQHAKVFTSTESPPQMYSLGGVQTESVDDGTYVLGCVPIGQREIHVDSASAGQAIEWATVFEGERHHLDLHVSRDKVIAGRLVDSRGNGLAGWLVDGRCTARRFKNEEDLQASHWQRDTRTGDSGEFVLLNCPRLEVTLEAFPPGGAAEQSGATLTISTPPAKDVSFVVPDSSEATSRIHGRLRMKDGSALPSIELYAFDADRKRSRMTRAAVDASTGEFHVGPFPAGSWSLYLKSDRLLPIEHDPVDLERGQDRDVGSIDLVAGGFVRAEVTHREKGDWKRVQLGLREEGNRILYVDLSGTTWKSAPLPAGTQWIVVKIDGKADDQRTLAIRSGEETLLEIEVD